MGNSPSVSDPDRGGAHAEVNITGDDHLARRRPVRFNVANFGTELAHSQAALDNNRKSSNADVPESYPSYTTPVFD